MYVHAQTSLQAPLPYPEFSAAPLHYITRHRRAGAGAHGMRIADAMDAIVVIYIY